MREINSSLRISSLEKEGSLQVSKWLHWQVLLSEEEMADLFGHLSPFHTYIVSQVVGTSHGSVTKEQFLHEYSLYVAALKKGIDPDEKRCRPFFSSVLTKKQEALYAMELSENRYLIKPILPVVQLQLHHLFFSHVDGKFYPMVHAQDSIAWGLQFSYPQLFQDPKTRAFLKVDDRPSFPNTSFFSELVKWLRVHTLPTPFVLPSSQKLNLSIRLGKGCWEWIGAHPHLLRKNITISPRRG